MTDKPVNGTIRIYACGGGGTNIAKIFEQSEKGSSTTADIAVSYIDTSRSNISGDIDPKSVYVLDNVDGSGKIRAENARDIKLAIPEILAKHPPCDYNLVLFTASGGTGSVAGPLLVQMLLERDEEVVAIVVGGEESGVSVTNTFNTFKSLQAVIKSTGKSLVAHYSHFERDVKRSTIDKQVHEAIAALSLAMSRRNKELDTRDVSNFLNFDRFHKELNPSLALLNIMYTPEDVEAQSVVPLTMVSLYRDYDDHKPQTPVKVSWDGYYSAPSEQTPNVHMLVTMAGLPELLTRIERLSEEYARQEAVQVRTAKFLSEQDDVDDDTGLVL